MNADFRGLKGNDQAKLYLYVGKAGGYWRIFGMTEDVGSVNEDGSPNDGEIPPVVNEEN